MSSLLRCSRFDAVDLRVDFLLRHPASHFAAATDVAFLAAAVTLWCRNCWASGWDLPMCYPVDIIVHLHSSTLHGRWRAYTQLIWGFTFKCQQAILLDRSQTGFSRLAWIKAYGQAATSSRSSSNNAGCCQMLYFVRHSSKLSGMHSAVELGLCPALLSCPSGLALGI